jgi:hypothetical protein
MPNYEGEFNEETYENELVQELLNIQDEQELDQFLGGLLSSAWSGAKKLYNSPIGQRIKNQAVSGLKSFGRKAIPSIARTVGGHFGGQQGADLAGRFSQWGVNQLGLEFEGEDMEAQSYNNARKLIKMAKDASRRIAAYARTGRPITPAAVRGIIMNSARRWFPELRTSTKTTRYGNNQRTGTWYRQGNKIIIEGI